MNNTIQNLKSVFADKQYFVLLTQEELEVLKKSKKDTLEKLQSEEKQLSNQIANLQEELKGVQQKLQDASEETFILEMQEHSGSNQIRKPTKLKVKTNSEGSFPDEDVMIDKNGRL